MRKARRNGSLWGLSLRFAVALVLVAVASALLSGVATIVLARQTQRSSLALIQGKSAAQIALLIERYIGNAAELLRIFEGSESLGQLPRVERDENLRRFLLHADPLISQVAFLDAEGRELSRFSRFHTFLPQELGQPTELPWSPPNTGQSSTSPIYVSRDSGLLSVAVTIPCPRFHGQPPAFLVAEVNASRLWREVQDVRIGATGYAYLVDGRGRFLAYQDLSQVLRRFGEDMSSFAAVGAALNAASPPHGEILEYLGLVGEPVLGTYERVRGTGWSVIVELPLREAYRELMRMLARLLGILLFCLAVAGLTGYLISQRLARPLVTLTEAARRLGAGDMANREGLLGLEQANPDEIGVLASSFRVMQDSLRRLYGDLEGRLEELERAEGELRSSLREKEILLKEIHHRVKNNLQIIASLLSLEADRIEARELRGLFEDSIGRVRAMSGVHELLYRSENLARVDVGEQLRILGEDLQSSYQDIAPQVELQVEAGSVELEIERAVPCGLLAHEILSNSFKHAFPGGRSGKITIRLRREAEGRVRLDIGDDGVGFPATTQGSSGIGLSLIELLADQLRAEITVDRTEGTRYQLRF